MDIVFCADRRMLAALHVAACSVMESLGKEADDPVIHVFSADLSERDADRLRRSLDLSGRSFSLKFHLVDGARFSGFPALQASFATYLRLVVAEVLDVYRFLYLDADILCRTDLLPLYHSDLNAHPIGLVPEAPIHGSADPDVARLLGDRAAGHYFNAGVMLVDAESWRCQDLTRRCLEFVGEHQPRYHDQSALNYVLHGDIQILPAHYNCRTNARENWSALAPPRSGQGHLLHFVDFPKPWSPMGHWVHPMGKIWWEFYRKINHGAQFGVPHPSDGNSRFRGFDSNYRKLLKDRLLFGGYSAGLFRNIKGID